MFKHTPWPWKVTTDPTLPYKRFITGGFRGRVLAELDAEKGEVSVERLDADAILMASAPYMLNVLKIISERYSLNSCRELIAEAIAKAEGEL